LLSGANVIKLFYDRKLRLFIMSLSICPWQASPTKQASLFDHSTLFWPNLIFPSMIITLTGEHDSSHQLHGVAPGFAPKCKSGGEKLARDRHVSLFYHRISGEDSFITLIPGAKMDPDTPPDWLQVPQEFSNGSQHAKCFQFTDEHC
jgi:hypothetical protein